MRVGSLFSGAGGLDMAVEQVFGAKTAWHCEINEAAAQVLARRYPNTTNHRDITTADWPQVEPVEIITAGWPCQPFSLAGKRKGADDERALWPHVQRAIRLVRPRYVVLENVPAVIGAELQRVASGLASLGYDIAWTCLRASDVGAPHRRDRFFALAYTQSIGRNERRPESTRQLRGSDAALCGRPDVGLLQTPSTADGNGSRKARGGDRSHEPLLPGQAVEMAERWGKYTMSIRVWETLTRPAPSPTQPNTKHQPRLNPAFSEWMMGWPAGWVTEVPGISRNDQLRIIGNGVVPQQAVAALEWLLGVPA